MGQGGGGGVGAGRRLMESIMYLKLQFWPVAGIKYIYRREMMIMLRKNTTTKKYNNNVMLRTFFSFLLTFLFIYSPSFYHPIPCPSRFQTGL